LYSSQCYVFLEYSDNEKRKLQNFSEFKAILLVQVKCCQWKRSQEINVIFIWIKY